jgi:hypothetical protein
VIVVRITDEERRTRLAGRHLLSTRAEEPVAVARALVGLHATDPATVLLAATARMDPPDGSALERALYEERSLVRLLGMRRTMFVVPVELAGVIQSAATKDIAVKQRSSVMRLIALAGVGVEPDAWLARVERATLEALVARGEATAAELVSDVPELGVQVEVNQGKNYAGKIGMSTQVLFLLGAEGRIIRGRPRGTWLSTLYRWVPTETWISGGIPEVAVGKARTELARRWLGAFGPAHRADLRWWTGWSARDTAVALDGLEVVEVTLDSGPGLLLAGDAERVAPVEPWAALLPALDPTTMGWSERSWYLGDHRPRLFDRSGNAGPTVWWCGRVVGGWAQREDGEIAIRFLEEVPAETVEAVAREADRMAGVLGPLRVKPRFRTPLERELIS